MRVVAERSRWRLSFALLLVLLVLLGVAVATAPRDGGGLGEDGIAGPHPSSVVDGLPPASPPSLDALSRGLGLAASVRQAPTTALPSDGSAVCPHAIRGTAAHGWSTSGGTDVPGTVGTAASAYRGRAPPAAAISCF